MVSLAKDADGGNETTNSRRLGALRSMEGCRYIAATAALTFAPAKYGRHPKANDQKPYRQQGLPEPRALI